MTFHQCRLRRPRKLELRQQSAFDSPDEYLLTIVTVNRNNAVNLARTLASLEQVRNNSEVECIFIDGASTDNSVAMARRFYASRNLVAERDTGIYNAMNKGLYRARGRYVLWLNSGDELLPNFWENTKAALREGDSAIVAFGLEKVWEDPRRLRYLIPTREQLPAIMLPHGGVFFDRKIVLDFGGYNECFSICGDKDLVLRLFYANEKMTFRDAVIGRHYADGISTVFGAGTDIENCYIAGGYGPPGRLRLYYWWLATDYKRVAQLWKYALFRLKQALRR